MIRPHTIRLRITAAATALPFFLAAANSSAQPAASEWRFVVMLGGHEIGEHRYRLEPIADGMRLHSEARLNLRILGFNAFSYQHEATETWRADCLERIESKTQQNARTYAVTGTREGDRFNVRTLRDSAQLPACVMSFAYWNPKVVGQRHLLNPQNGDYEDVTVETGGMETVTTSRGTLQARRHTLVGRKARIDVWYTPDGRWVGLESTTDIGQRLRYVLQ